MKFRVRFGRATVAAVFALALVAAIGGCGIYSGTSGRVDESIRRVSVPYFENRTAEPNIEVLLTDEVISALQRDNTLKVVDESSADSVLRGSVTRYQVREAFTNPQQTVDEYQVQIALRLTFFVKQTGTSIFEERTFTGAGNYVLADPEFGEPEARAQAAQEIVNDVLAQVVEEW
ncbi:MAG: LptE family protein [Candidatus Krumholzibacteriia bacterium]